MKKALWYEIKRNLLPLVIFAAIAVVIAVGYTMMADLEYVNGLGEVNYRNSCIGCYAVILCILCTVTPMLQFSYRMKQRSVDLWYSLPITRKQLTLVRTVGGLVLTLVPFTLAYWLGVATVATRGAHFYYSFYPAAYALFLLLGAGLFGVNAFLFTRGNSVADGIVFVAAWACALPLVFTCIDVAMPVELVHYGQSNSLTFGGIGLMLFTYSPIAVVSTIFDDLVLKKGWEMFDFISLNTWTTMPAADAFAFVLVVAAVMAAAAYLGLFLLADRDKSENVAQVSSSWWGYKVIIPVYGIAVYAMIVTGYTNGGWPIEMPFYTALVAVAAFVLYFAYRRSFRLKKWDIIMVVIILAAGIALAYILYGIDSIIVRTSGGYDYLSAALRALPA